MRILVCVKRVPAPGARINVTADGQAVDAAHLGFTTSPHEECAVEEAVQITERLGGEVTVMTLGPAEAEEQLRYAASVGAHRLVLLPITEVDWDPQRTATALASAIGDLETADGPFDLILFGNESADAGGFQVGVRVAYALGRPIVNGIKGIDVGGDADGGGSETGDVADGTVAARREIDGGFEVYRVSLPAVLGVKEGINLPRYPTMKGRLASKKAEVALDERAADVGGQGRVRLHRPEEQVSETVILGAGPEAAPAVVDLFEELGVLA
ncbi:MAG: electron transfer flavoprotein beta subunit/FixA family protein [Actinomycetota bacterium]|nr:electron transfer flavoprotein beta subunit/FixA family protein [Actinomycetota bacterium]MEC9395762.1 electron transfer flavoprotein beta subunit/FixA family protein [Actinomycetota bacterium]MEC9467328.1 electron transfer flavoprotein beta subunit/FixA family protein [Actinomycetota bacterium]MED6328782.1 electron transfer flavoprotein beta subunit/FixA family protein [Actinomycetota bacterium]MEE2957797.1 electron transfer flavoprotein beta subunit/FixA family protein [Actinomycetota bact